MKSFFQSLLGTVVGLVLFAVLGFVFLFAMAAAMGPKPPSVQDKAVLIFDLSRGLPDKHTDDDPAAAIRKAIQGGAGQDVSLPSLIKALDQASEDPKISGLFITGNLQGGGAAAMLELKQALKRFNEKKQVLSYNHAWGRGEMYLCSGLGSMYVNPFGIIDVSAPSVEMMFFANAFKKYGIEVQVTKFGKYKSAVEPFIQDRMSAENREQVKGFVGEIWDGFKTEIAKGRGISPADIQRLADTKLLLYSDHAIAEKLVDKVAYYDEVLDELKIMAGKKADSKDFPQIDIESYIKVPGKAQKGKNRIAIVVAEGQIVDGEGASDEIGGDSLARELRELRMNKNVKAVVMRVNSPGGSALASDLIQREVNAIKNAGKPFIVSMGNVAASGGYWISATSDRIFAEPGTITGSIGVFGMFPNVKKLAESHGVTFDAVQMAELGGPSLFRPFNAKELVQVQAYVDHTYDIFLDKVSESRGMAKKDVHEIAQGRVWAGRKAVELGLVDELGGLDDAIKHAAKLANIEGDYRIDTEGAPSSPFEKIMKNLGGGEKRKLVKIGPVGEAKNELEAALKRLRSLNDPNGVYALAPMVVVK
jgi:protease-4